MPAEGQKNSFYYSIVIILVEGGSAYQVSSLSVWRICPADYVILTNVYRVKDSVAVYVCHRKDIQHLYP